MEDLHQTIFEDLLKVMGLKSNFLRQTPIAMTVRLTLTILFLSFNSFAICQTQSDCGERPESTKKLFVFIGELLDSRSLPVEERQASRFLATYRILERVCGNHIGDTISVNVAQWRYHADFRKSRYKLIIQTTYKREDSDESSWNLDYDVFKTVKNKWVGVHSRSCETTFEGQKNLIPKKVRFSNDAFFNTRGMSTEEINLDYPEPYYKLKNNKAIPVLGYSINELFQHKKNGSLSRQNIFEAPPEDTSQFLVKEIEIQDPEEENLDSVKQELQKAYLIIKDSIKHDPFNLKYIGQLADNCRAQEDYTNYKAYFDDLVRDYPDSIKTYLIKAKYGHRWPSLEDSSKIQTLLKVISIDSNSYEASYEMADTYYRLFREQPGNYFAQIAREWFLKCVDIDKGQLVLLKIPILQLSSYLNDVDAINLYKKQIPVKSNAKGIPEGNRHNWYFPAESFLIDSTKWITDYSIDATRELDAISFSNDWFSEILASMQEPVLAAGFNGQAYRFLWLRTYETPIVIRMEKSKKGVFIYWKELKFNDSIQDFEIPVEHMQKISTTKWKQFEKMLAVIDYWSMASSNYPGSTHPDISLLEASINGRYKVIERYEYRYSKYVNCLKYLIDLTDLNIPISSRQ